MNLEASLNYFETVTYPKIWRRAFDLGVEARAAGLPFDCNLQGKPFCHNNKCLKVYKSAWEQGWESESINMLQNYFTK